MLIGDPSSFAIESCISIAYEELGARALGFFVIHINGRCFGVREPDATWLACSFDEVARRLAGRGTHTAPFATEPDAGKIADAHYDARYGPAQENKRYFGLRHSEFLDRFYSNNLEWSPGDEEFDDGSSVFHFDAGGRVRLFGYRLKRREKDYPRDLTVQTKHKGEFHRYQHDPDTLSDLWLEADEFYEILGKWRDAFEVEWRVAPKLFKAHGPDEHHEQHLSEIMRLAGLSESLRQSRGGARS